jgi:hypothetical protein
MRVADRDRTAGGEGTDGLVRRSTDIAAHRALQGTFALWQDGRAAAERGWIIEATTHAPPRIAVGKAIRNAVLTGVITVIYVRDPT